MHDAVGVGPDLDGESVGVAEPLLGEDLDGRAGRHHAAVVEQDDVVGHGGGLVEVVKDDPDGDAVVVGEILDEVEELRLVAQVEVVGRLVEQEDAGVLREAGGQPDPLPFAPESSSTGRSAIAVTPVSSMARAIAREPSASRSPVIAQPVRR